MYKGVLKDSSTQMKGSQVVGTQILRHGVMTCCGLLWRYLLVVAES